MSKNEKTIRVTIEMNGTRYGYRQIIPLPAPAEYVAYAIASTIQNTIIEHWEDGDTNGSE